MKKLIVLPFIAMGFTSSSQNSNLPVIDSAGMTFINFVPKGWSVIDTAFGDLNKDKIADVAMLLESNDSLTEFRYDCDTKKWDDEERGFPRILVVLFKNKKDGKYHLTLQNNDFMLRSDEGGMGGLGTGDLEIKNNVLGFDFSGGMSQKWMVGYKFRFQNNDWFLVGGYTGNFHGALGTYHTDEYNFLTGKVKVTEGVDIFDNAKYEDTWRSIPKMKLRSMKSLIRPYCWEIEPGIIL